MSLFPRLCPMLNRLRFLIATAGKPVAIGRRVVFAVPVRADGEGRVTLADRVHLGYRLAPRMGSGEILLQARSREAQLSIGEGCAFSNNVSLIAVDGISLGRDCLIGDGVLIVDSDFHQLDPDRRGEPPAPARPVTVEDNVWIGSRALILKGVRIGSGAVVGAAAVVVHDVPARSVVAGNPARVIKQLA